MIIYGADGTPILDVQVDDTSYRYRRIMNDCQVILEFSLTSHVEIPTGSYIEYQTERYEVLVPESVKIQHSRCYEYKVTFEGNQSKAKKYKVHNMVDGRLQFDLVAKPQEHLKLIVDNLNEREGSNVWSVGSYADSAEKLVSYNHIDCGSALTSIADAFGTEWEVNGHVISLRKVEYPDSVLALAYGKGQGFVPGIERVGYGNSMPVQKLYVQGGSDNISLKEYGASTLHLPKDLSFSFDGQKFSWETGYVSSKAKSMVTDANGFSVKISNAPSNAVEDSLDLSDIKPQRVGTVSGVRFEYNNWYYTYEELIAAYPDLTDEDWENVQVDIVDASIPADLDYHECLMENNEPLTVIFQSGSLSGREFNATFEKQSRTQTRTVEGVQQTVTRPANRFELVKAAIDGFNMPTRNFLPASGNTYAVFNCYLPAAYVSDAESHTGAEYDMLREAAMYLYENSEMKFTFVGELDGLFAKRDWVNIGSKIKLGGMIQFSHPQIQPTAVLIRIVGIKDYINRPYSPEIEISSETIKGGLSSSLKEINNELGHVEERTTSVRRYAARSFRDAKETAQMLVDAALENFDPSISPIAIQTMQMLVGDESLQFKFWTSRACTVAIPNPVYYDNETKQVKADACVLQHMTLGIDSVSPTHQLSEYKIWNMSAYVSAILAEPQKKYYVYAKVDSSNDGTSHLTGQFVMSETAIGMRDVSGYYHLLVGMLMSEKENDRSFAPMFGFTEVLPGQITADRIMSPNGLSYFDMLANAARLGGGASAPYIEWNRNGNGKMRIHGALNVDGGGAESPQLVERGPYDQDEYYYWGDVITFQGSAYLNIYELGATKGIPPTDTTRWRLWISKGDSGVAQFKSIVFKRTNSTPATPTGGSYESPVPSGWSDGVPSGEQQLWMSTNVFCSDGTSGGWTTPRPATDTADIDFEFSAVETNPGTPTSAPSNWHNTATSSDIWMAVRKCKNGTWGSWEVSKIKGEKGADAEPIRVQYSANGTSWHDSYQSGDEYMRIYSQGSWGSAVKIKGETGHIGPDGKKAPYHDFMFGISAYTSASGAPSDISSWSDTPPATTSSKPYLWCRDRYYSVSTSNEWVLSSTSYYRLTGEAGAQGKSVAVQWSADGSSWHDTYQSGDKYMRERVGDGTWSAAIKVVGEDGQPGADGKYTSFVFKNSWEKPSTPTGTSPIPSGWSDTPESADIGLPTFEGAWSVNGNVITSNAISHSQQTWEKIKFSTNRANAIVKIKIAAYSENNYDWGYICKLDSAYSTSNYLKRVSGTNQDTATITVATAGDHYIYVGYVKDGSQSVAPDQVVVEVVTNQIWMSKCDVQNGVASGNWTSPVLLTGANGVNGSDGTNGNLTKHQWAKTLTTTQPAESEWKNDFSQVADHSGYYLWQRLLESIDGGVTWTVNAATVGIILDPTITKEEAEIQYALEEAARATVAEKLGYSSWESFSDAVAASQVLIQNGQINASLINTDLLIAKVVETSAALRRILIFNNEMNVIDDAENTVVRVHGGYNSSIYQFSNVSGSQSSVSFMPTQNTKQESSSFSVTTTYLGSKELYVGDRENAQYTGNSFTISNSGVSRMSGRIKAYLTTDWSNLSGFSSYSFGWHYVEARFYLSRRSSYCDYSANLGSCYASANGPIYTTKYVDFNVNLDAGTYYVFVEISGSGSILEQGMQDYRTKTYSGQLNASCQSQQNAAATVLLLQEKLEIFANGLGYRQSNNDYAVLLRTGSGRDASGYLQAEILSGVAGLRLGNNGSSSYLDAKLGKTWFSLVPKVMASWTWNGSSYVLQKWMVRGYNGSNTPYSIAVSDGVNFNLPSDYSGEQFSNSDIYIATAWYTDSSHKDTAFVYKVNATQLIIKIDKMGGGMERVNVSLIVW